MLTGAHHLFIITHNLFYYLTIIKKFYYLNVLLFFIFYFVLQCSQSNPEKCVRINYIYTNSFLLLFSQKCTHVKI